MTNGNPPVQLRGVTGSRVPPDMSTWLTELGQPIFVAPPRSNGDKHEFRHPERWQLSTVEGSAAQLARFRPGWAVMVLLGGRVVVIDVDPRNGADAEKVRAALGGAGVRIYAEIATPSGGRHFYVAGHPDVPSVGATDVRDGLVGFPGVEVLSYGRNAFLPGTQRPKYGGKGYAVVFDDLATLADGGDETSGEALAGWVASHRVTSLADQAPASPPWDGKPLDARQSAYVTAALSAECKKVAAMKPDSGRNIELNNAAFALGRYVAGAGLDETAAVEGLTAAARRNDLAADDGERSVAATIRSGMNAGKRKPKAVPPPKDDYADMAPNATRSDAPTPPAAGGPLNGLRGLLAALREWQDLPDPTHLVTALAVATTKREDGEACWLLLVAAPSSGKTEAVRALDDTADARLDEVTAAGLLGWSKGKTVQPSGVLSRIGSHALLTIGDLSNLLATSDRGGRDQVFALLRRAYDGHCSRDISPPGKIAEGAPERLEWSGRLTVIGCVTGVIDRYAAHADQLGARWLYVRLPERDTAQKRRASALARRGDLARHRGQARALAAATLAAARNTNEASPNVLPTTVLDGIEDAALVTAWGRGAVPRNGYGRREIEGMPVVEEPMRLVQQLGTLARGVLALGLPDTAALTVARRVAMDSMPESRRKVLEVLSTGEDLTTAGVARAARLHRHVARMMLEDLAAIGVVEHDRDNEEDDNPVGAVHWSLCGDDGDLIAQVFSDHARAGGWHETWVSPAPSSDDDSPIGERGGGLNPRFVPPDKTDNALVEVPR